MPEELKPGDKCIINDTVKIRGLVAFKKGESVSVKQVQPDPDRPEYKYVVFSQGLQREFKLSKKHLSREKATSRSKYCEHCGATLSGTKYCSKCGARIEPPRRAGPRKTVRSPAAESSKGSKIAICILTGVLLLIIAVASIASYASKKEREVKRVQREVEREQETALDACMADPTWGVVENMAQVAGEPQIWVTPHPSFSDVWVVQAEFMNGDKWEWIVDMRNALPEVRPRGPVR